MKLGISEIYTPAVHGMNEKSSKNILGNYLVVDTVELDEFYSGEYLRMIEMIRKSWMHLENPSITTNVYSHPIIRNFKQVTESPKYISLDILDVEELEGGEMVGIKKTFWLRIFQRKCRKYLSEMRQKISTRSNPTAIFHKKVTGVWPSM